MTSQTQRLSCGSSSPSSRSGYACSALATDRYPPFTLAEAADYPARLELDYPRSLARGRVSVKWWLLALPHYVVIAVFERVAWTTAADTSNGLGLTGLLVLLAAVALLFTGRYPRPLSDFVMGLDRWVFRVAAYSLLMTDVYSPFRLDMGGNEPPSDGPAITPSPAPVPTA